MVDKLREAASSIVVRISVLCSEITPNLSKVCLGVRRGCCEYLASNCELLAVVSKLPCSCEILK